jgi:hypothetical protein
MKRVIGDVIVWVPQSQHLSLMIKKYFTVRDWRFFPSQDIQKSDLKISVKTWRRSIRGEIYKAHFTVEVCNAIVRTETGEKVESKTTKEFNTEVFTSSGMCTVSFFCCIIWAKTVRC